MTGTDGAQPRPESTFTGAVLVSALVSVAARGSDAFSTFSIKFHPITVSHYRAAHQPPLLLLVRQDVDPARLPIVELDQLLLVPATTATLLELVEWRHR